MEYSHNFNPGSVAGGGPGLTDQQQAIQMAGTTTTTSMTGSCDGTTMSSPYYSRTDLSMTNCIGSSSFSAPMDDCSSGFQSTSISNYPSELPSSASTTINEYPPQPMPSSSQQQQQQPHPLPPPTNTANNSTHIYQLSKPLPDDDPRGVIEELGRYISEDRDTVVVLHSVLVLFTYTVNSVETRQQLSASPATLSSLYNLLTEGNFNNDSDDSHVAILHFAGATLEYISRYPEGRTALLGCNGLESNDWPSRGIKTLISSLKSVNSHVVVFAIQAIHRLLIDEERADNAKKQIIYAGGVKCIVDQLATQLVDLENIGQFKVVVMTCLQILAYGDMENKLAIYESGGPGLLLRTIRENFNYDPNLQPQADELIETASRVLKSLSVCPSNKDDIIRNDGIQLLTECIKRDNQEILKTCLWTLRNLSDVINNNLSNHNRDVKLLVERLLAILSQYLEEPFILSCALGIMANITCNNEPIKQFICEYNHFTGIDLLLNTIDVALLDYDFRRVNNEADYKKIINEVLEPAVYTLCHLMNQAHYPRLLFERQRVKERLTGDPIKNLKLYNAGGDLEKAYRKLYDLLD
ncbi:armadillo segment polarity -like [Olea europaea subsp. europaea]|uniref:Armadillo segment polarity -like n=1 Tax=Olea europaea subsp. europaea TaxID=158383 RepID=A0A8S0TRJ0_OLEEU|nr:armadillo segment polarity -like [Olea europaea subsp. europaea]